MNKSIHLLFDVISCFLNRVNLGSFLWRSKNPVWVIFAVVGAKMFSVCFPSLSTDLIGLWLMIWCDAADAIEKPIIQQRELLANVCPFHWEAEKKQKKSNFALVDLLVAQHANLCTGKLPISIQFSRNSSLTASLKAWLLAGIRTRDGKMEIVMALPVAYNFLISYLIWDTFWQPFQGTENQAWAQQVSKRAGTLYRSCPWPAKKQS